MSAVKRNIEDEDTDPNKKARADPGDLQELRVLIENPEASIIIGKGGANVKMVRTESGAFVSILKTENAGAKERVLTLKGTPENNAKAGQLITTLLINANNERKQSNGDTENKVEEYSFRLLIHKFLAGCIIGKAGAIIKEIQTQTGAKISITNDTLGGSTEKQVSVTGTPETVFAALSKITSQLNENPLREGSSSIPYVPGAVVAAPYGAPGGYPAAPAYGGKPGYAAPYAPPQAYSPYGAIATPFGADPHGVKTEKIVIPSVCAGTVIGKSGSIIAEIKSQSACQISIAAAEPTAPQDRVVSITGTQQGINTAIQLIRQRVESYQPPEGVMPGY
jgi:polyribonucleotide nucleotidyltransferase